MSSIPIPGGNPIEGREPIPDQLPDDIRDDDVNKKSQHAWRPEFTKGGDWGDDEDRSEFADPGGKSALRAATKRNPRNRPCPTCKRPNRLTAADVARHYQCDSCADRAEAGYDSY